MSRLGLVALFVKSPTENETRQEMFVANTDGWQVMLMLGRC